MVKKVNDTKIKQNSSVQADSVENNSERNKSNDRNTINRPMEIEESLDFKMYQMASMCKGDLGVSIKCSEEDTPRRNLPIPEPSNSKGYWKDCRNNANNKNNEEQNNQNSLDFEINKDAILVKQEFSEDELYNQQQNNKYENNKNINRELMYPFRKENTALSKFCEFQILTCRNNFSSKPFNGSLTSRSQNDAKIEDRKSDNQNLLANNIPSSDITNHIKSSKSFSRLRQPTNVHRDNRKSLDCIKTNLMSRHYNTLKDRALKISTKSNLKDHFDIQRISTSPKVNCGNKTPILTRNSKKNDFGTGSYIRSRLRM